VTHRTVASQAKNQDRLVQQLDQIEAELNALIEHRMVAVWNRCMGIGTESPDAIKPAISNLLLNPFCKEVLSLQMQDPIDAVLAQRIRVLRREILKAQVETPPDVTDLRLRATAQLNSLHPQVAGKKVSRLTLANILRYETDRALRRKAWLALRPLHKRLAGTVALLMQRRNRHAQAVGFDDAMDWTLAIQDLAYGNTLDLLDELDRLSVAPYQDVLDRCCTALSVGDLRPWDISYALELAFPVRDLPWGGSQLVAYCQRLSTSLGFPGDGGIQVSFKSLPFPGMCFPIAPPHDVRLLLAHSAGWSAYAGMLHEWGHALHTRHVGQPNYVVARGDPGCLAEGLAQLFFLLGIKNEWLCEIDGLSAADAQAVVAHQRARRLVRLRRLLANACFERAAYVAVGPARRSEDTLPLPPHDTLVELSHLWRKVQEHFTLLDHADDPGWAAQSAFALYPGYWVIHVFASRPNVIPINPQLPTPVRPAQIRKLAVQLSRCQALEHIHHLRWHISWRTADEQVDMIHLPSVRLFLSKK